VALCITDRASVQPIGHSLSLRIRDCDLAAEHPHAAQVCHLMVSILVIHAIAWIITHLLTLKEWKAELAWLVDL